MKILIFMENNQKGGLDTFCATLINAWPDEKDCFVFICNASHPGIKTVREMIHRPCEFVSHRIPLSWVLSRRLLGWLPGGFRRVSQPFLRILLYPWQYRALRSLFQCLDGDALVVVNGGFPGGESCRIANIAWADFAGPGRAWRNIHNFHNFAVAPRRGFGWYENRVDRRLAAAAGRLISVSRSCAESLRRRRVFRDSTAISHIYNGIEANATGAGERLPKLRHELSIGDAPLCLILANYEARKGHRFLFEAFGRVAEALPEAHLVACGGGSEEERAEVEAARRELAPNANIHLVGFVPGGARLIEQVDVVTISSQSFESFGLTAVEGMIRGVPVVATRTGGLPEVVGEDGDGGYTVAADDPAGFAARIIELLGDPERRRQVGERGRARVAAHFTAERMAAEYHAALSMEALPDVHPAPPAPHGEWHYVLRRCLAPAMAWQSAAVVFSAVARRLGNRLRRRRDRYYPAAIRALAEAAPATPEVIEEPPPATLPEGPRRLKLATGHLAFTDWPEWRTPFEDHEQFVSLHRWNWLLRALTDETRPADLAWGVALIRSWLAAMPTLPEGDAGESYTTGERIANAALFARHTGGDWRTLPADIRDALECMAADLAQRVEYHGGGLSGNHVLNNARALLFAGHCCERPELVILGRALLAERLPLLIVDGFLREGSAHYQLLCTRWLLELRLLAEERADGETLALLTPQLPGLLAGCRFFRVAAADGGHHLATFGDISPDCEPAWLADLPESPLVGREAATMPSGWAALFSDSVLPTIETLAEERDAAAWRPYPRAGWYRLDDQGWTAIWRAESSSGPAIASHAHHDVCACVLYREGREVLIDPGRFDYGGSPLGRYGVGGEAHNGVTLNGRPPLLSRGDRLLPERHRRARCVVDHRTEEGRVVVSIEHDGFSRLGGGVERHRRRFIFSTTQVEIVDRFEGRGRYWMEGRFHRPLEGAEGVLPGRYPAPPASFTSMVSLELLESPSEMRESALVAGEQPLGGWRFPAYGVKEAALTQRFVTPLALPAECRYRLVERNG